MKKYKIETFNHKTEYTIWVYLLRLCFSVTIGFDSMPTIGVGVFVDRDFSIWVNAAVINISFGFDFGKDWRLRLMDDDEIEAHYKSKYA
jgi:hypothetical protein